MILCDHASRHIPDELHDLGLGAPETISHIAWDIGAAGIAEALSDTFDAPAVFSPASRLVVDCNRQLEDPDLIPERSAGIVIPGNQGLDTQARARRIARWFRPYHEAIESVLIERERRAAASIVLSIHSMTANLAGSPRPWPIAFSSDADRSLVQPMLEYLRQSRGIDAGDNQPYSMDPAIDYTIPFHAVRRGLPYLQVEFQQEQVQSLAGQFRWARIFATALSEVLPIQPQGKR